MKISEYHRGYRDAMRAAITWLHAQARTMNDPHARQLLNNAAFSLGVHTAKGLRSGPVDDGGAP